MKIVLLRARFSHMGRFSGYDRLSDSLISQKSHSYTSIWRPNSVRFPFILTKLWKRSRPKIHATPFYGLLSFQLELDTAWNALRTRPDLIHVLYLEDTLGFLPYLRQKFFPKTKLVATAHQPPCWWKINRLEPYWLNSLDALIVLDSVSKTYLSHYMEADKIHVIPHGVDTAFFQPCSKAEWAVTNRFLYVGQWLRDLAFFEKVVGAISLIKPNLDFDLVFKPGDLDTLNPAMIRLAQNPKVHFHANLTDKQLLARYQQAALLTLPLLDSTANNAVLEAMATGTPVLTSRVGGVEDYLPTNTGLLFGAQEHDLFVQAALDLLENPSKRTHLGRELRQKAEREFDWAIIANRIAKLYQTIAHKE